MAFVQIGNHYVSYTDLYLVFHPVLHFPLSTASGLGAKRDKYKLNHV